MEGGLVTCFVLFLSVFAHRGAGLSTGAPSAACDTLMPNHGVPPQSTPAPYSITMEGNTFMVGELKKGQSSQ